MTDPLTPATDATDGPGVGSRGRTTLRRVAAVRLFAQARLVAGVDRDRVEAATVADAVAVLEARYGPAFAELLTTCRLWVDGEPAIAEQPLSAGSELAVLPPVSGGASSPRSGRAR